MRKTNRQQWDPQDMANAIRAVQNGEMGWLRASKAFNVPFTTLRRRASNANKRVKNNSTGLGRFFTTFTPEQEKSIVDHLKQMEQRLFGITCKELRSLIYEWAEINKIPHRFNKNEKRAGLDWVRGFRSRNPEITLRKPENTSIARAMAFNKPNIAKFFKTYQEIIEKYKLGPEKIYNVDESGISTVQNPPKIFASTGKKQVGTIAGAERGIHITVVCCTNPLGSYIPPAFIFPRKNWKVELLEGAPTGSVGFPQESGWMTGEIFQQWMKHFEKYSNPSKDSPVLLILDGHVSHKSWGVLNYAKQHGIILLCLPAHCSHRIQPLDVSFFSPLKTFLNQEITKKIRGNDGRAISQLQLAGIFRPAYEKAATLENAASGFKNTGLWPLDPNVFPEYLYAPSSVTDQNILSTEATSDAHPTEGIADASDVEKVRPTERHTNNNLKEDGPKIVPLTTISPLPSTSAKTSVKRKKTPAVLTSSPFMLELKEKEDAKREKERRVSARKVKKRVCINMEDEEEEEPAYENSNFGEDDDDDAFCIFCCEKFSRSKAKEKWIRCCECRQWAHVECAGISPKVKTYICDVCN